MIRERISDVILQPGEALPFELALREDGTSYALDPERPVVGFNAYSPRTNSCT